jgi:chemotaxis response regulator CheB
MIAVVLTGSGSDGSEGVHEVSKKGGIVIAQDPATAEYTGMPDATIRTGLTNYISPLSSIVRILVSIVSGTRSPAEVA